jgi:hypothetical protein
MFSEKDDLVNIDLVRLGPGGSNLLNDVDDLLALMDMTTSRSRDHAPPADIEVTLKAPEESQLKKRKKKFVGSRLARVEFGMLVDDMRIGKSFELHLSFIERERGNLTSRQMRARES